MTTSRKGKAAKPAAKSKKKSKPVRRSGWGGLPLHVRLLFGLLAALLLVVVLLSLLGPVRRWVGMSASKSPPPQSQPEPSRPPVVRTEPHPDVYPLAQRNAPPPLEDLQVEVESVLWRAGISREKISPRSGATPPRWEVTAPYLDQPLRRDLSERLHQLSPDLTLTADAADATLAVRWRSQTLFQLKFRPITGTPSASKPAAQSPRMAIIMDDLGGDLATALALIRIDLPVTFAVLPDEPAAEAVARAAHRNGREVMLHIPMEPEDYPAVDPGDTALWLHLPALQVRERVLGYLARVPHAIGGNNHMGSRFTSDAGGMQAVLSVLKERNLFFVDSRTTARSVALAEARKLGVPALGRDVFLDNERDVDKILAQLRKLEELASHRGSAVGICHPYAETLEALRRESRRLKRIGIAVVPVSRLLPQG